MIFVDLFFICQRDYSLSEAVSFFEEKFKMVTYDLYHVYTSLVYFNDTEKDDVPRMFIETNWEQIKTILLRK